MALTLGGGIVLPLFVQSQPSNSKKICKELVPSASSATPTDQKALPTNVTTKYGTADFSLTEKLLAYMGGLLEKNILGDTHLHRVLEMTEQGKIQNPISEKDATKNKGLHAHRGGFEILLRDKESLLDLPRTKVWTETMLAERGQIQKQRQETRKDTQYVPKPPQEIKITSGEITSLLVLPDGKWVVGTDKVYIRNTDGTPSSDFEVNGWVQSLLLSGRWKVGCWHR